LDFDPAAWAVTREDSEDLGLLSWCQSGLYAIESEKLYLQILSHLYKGLKIFMFFFLSQACLELVYMIWVAQFNIQKVTLVGVVFSTPPPLHPYFCM